MDSDDPIARARTNASYRMFAWSLIANERARQVTDEGFDEDHDDAHEHGEMAVAAALFAGHTAGKDLVEQATADESLLDPWPWDKRWDKRDQVPHARLLAIAGALIMAELERLLRRDKVALPPSLHVPTDAAPGLESLIGPQAMAQASAEGEQALYRAELASRRAKKALQHYLSELWRAVGLAWNSDSAAEVQGIVDDIVEAATERAKVDAS